MTSVSNTERVDPTFLPFAVPVAFVRLVVLFLLVVVDVFLVVPVVVLRLVVFAVLEVVVLFLEFLEELDVVLERDDDVEELLVGPFVVVVVKKASNAEERISTVLCLTL